MRTYELRNADGQLHGFEVDNGFIARATVGAIVRRIPGGEVVELHRSWWGPDEFCRFRVGGVDFMACEPFGDNSRYWIGPDPPRASAETMTVLRAFQAYRPAMRRPAATGAALLVGGVVAGVLSRGASGEAAWRGIGLFVSMAGLMILGVAAAEWLGSRSER